MRAQTSASVRQQFYSCAGLGASESTQASDAGGQPGAAGNEGRAGSGPERLSSVQIARLVSVFRNVPPRQRPLGEKGRSVPCSADPHRGESRRRWRAARAGVSRAARSVATAARKLAPPAPARDACGPAIVIEMSRRRRAATSRGPLGGVPGRTGAAWAVAQRSPVGRASSAVETGWPAGMASAPPVVCGSIVWAPWPPPICTRRGLAASATAIVSVSTPCS
jgi:hypothetical protein